LVCGLFNIKDKRWLGKFQLLAAILFEFSSVFTIFMLFL